MGKKIQCIGRYVMDGITLGKGNFARVELATHGVTACKVAIKIIDTRKIKEEYVRQNLHREARILGQLRHPNVIRLYETLKATTLYCLVLECASGGNLLAYIKTFKDYLLPEDKGRPYVRQLVSAVHYLHERGVAHRDLKMENIMLDEKKKNIKIVDFGLSNTFSVDDLMKTHCGSPEYAAPELFSSTEKYGPEIDIWSIGIILYAMVVGKLPFTTPYTDQYRRQKLLQQMEKGLSEQHDREMAHLTIDCKDLLRKLIEPCPDLRLPAPEIERHAWITNNEKLAFFPFHAFPRDKPMKTQVMEELSDMLSMNKEQVEKTVHECKCDDLSAMFNMMMDNKRGEKGVFDLDYTSRQEKKPDTKVHKHRRKTNHSKAEQNKTCKEKANAVPHNTTQLDEPSPKTGTSGEKSLENEHKVSATFDFMALCSAPTWLGHEKKRTSYRHRRLSHNPALASPNPGSDASNDALSVPHDPNNPNLLSPNLAAHVPFQRRSFRRSSSHRKKRFNSCGPHNRRTNSLKGAHGSSSSQPNSPTTMLSPSIRIDPPRPPPIPRPKELGVTECYHLSPVMLHVPDSKGSSFTNINGSVPAHAASNHGEKCVTNNSDSSNPCSTTELLSCEGSMDTLSNSRDFLKHDWTDSGHDSETAVAKIPSSVQCKLGLPVPVESSKDTVEARIASMDIKSIVRPKQYSSMQNRKHKDVINSEPKLGVLATAAKGCSGGQDKVCVNFTDSEHIVTNSSTASLDNDPISMQSSDYKNLNFHAKGRCAQCIERSVSENSNEARVVVTGDSVHLSDVDGNEDLTDSTTELLGATSSSNIPPEAKATGVKPDMADSIKVCSVAAGCSEEVCHYKQNEICTSSDSNVFVSLPKNGPNSSTKSSSSKGSKSKSKELQNAVEYSPDVEAFLEDSRDTISSASTRCSNNSLYKLVMPSTPTRQMFKTPLARIESFHSDDFDALASADMDFTVKSPSLATTPSSSVNTPTLPCFAYKLHLHKKKNAKLKANKLNKTGSASSGGKDSSCVNDSDKGGHCKVAVSDSELRLDPSCSEPLVSSGSDACTERTTDDANDKPSSVSKAKIHPMDKEEQDTGELILRGTKINSKSIPKNKCMSSSSAETTGNDIKARKQQNSVEKTSKPNNSENKKVSIKCSPWKHGFVHFLRKKRQGQGYRAGSHNNNDSINSNYHSSSNATTTNTRNGHTRTSYNKPLLTSQDDNSGEMETQFTSSPIPTFSDALEVRSSPAPGLTPTPTTTAKVFDFTVITSESPQAKSCLLSWKGCRECTFSDDQLSEDGGSECAFRFEQSVDVAIKTTMAIKSVQDAKNYSAYKYAHT